MRHFPEIATKTEQREENEIEKRTTKEKQISTLNGLKLEF